jgi:hypothetical protein
MIELKPIIYSIPLIEPNRMMDHIPMRHPTAMIYNLSLD